ncbi:putative inactive receptor kinase [Hibiscus syriacus]|uniref:Inactive receptor kinase n=1 Tax=Hibiscus syriacus TaxID=106335 RepID=A0A6A3AB32_HIBSY|nr:probable inactive receptor kinase At5g16590 [Hibiscus syriacus]KAE8701308.1 putative inactive receptor kinase [Hibiscus syriacus]
MKLIIFSLSILTILLVSVSSDLASDRAALVALRSAVGGRSLLWNLSSSPCSWTGVNCSQNRVVELRLPGMGLSGQLPIAIGNLTQLQTLSLRFNALSGPIPSDFANLSSLRNLYLQGNAFSCEIPEFLFTLQNLIRLNLANNNFTGSISGSVNNLTRLGTLYLENNKLSGSIPDIGLASLVQFNVSFNQLNGSIPKALSGKPRSAFQGNSLCGKPLVSCDGSKDSDSKLSGGAIAGIVIGCVLVASLILILLICLCARRSGKKTEARDIAPAKQAEIEISGDNTSNGLSGGPKNDAKSNENKNMVIFRKASRVFDLDHLLKASAEVLGKGTFGTAYKASLDKRVAVVVKRLKDVTVSEKEFRAKMEVVGAMDHQNLVPVRAYYFSRDEKLLVYDYMPMGSLSALLHGNRGAGRTPLNWDTRSNIALGAARGIAYLHSKAPGFSHGNIKSSNILLTTSYEAHVSDFGLAQLARPGPTSTPNRVDGYRAPEVTDARKISQKADVYSFGVLLLELLTGKAPTHALTNDEGVDLPRWVQSVVREEWTAEVFDLELLRYQNVEEYMVQLLQIAINCTAQYPDKRPAMEEVTSQIEELCRSSNQKNIDK